METLLRKELAQIVSGRVEWDCPLSNYTSFAIGGPAVALVIAEDQGELSELLDFFQRRQVPWRIIGNGTNLLVRDEGFPGVIVQLGQVFEQIEFDSGRDDGTVQVMAGGGCGLARLAMACIEKGLAGLEFAVGIPGTVGGAVIMNAGAWGGDIASILEEVILLAPEGRTLLVRRELNFSYRRWTDYPKYAGRAVVIGATFNLAQDDPAGVRRRSQQLLEKRRASQPKGKGNAGSFFRNPEGDSAGRLIEASGLKGKRVGGAMVSEEHANFLVNTGEATANDVLTLMRLIQAKVKGDSGVELEPEVHFI